MVDFNIEHSLRTVLGFNEKTYTVGTHASKNPVDIMSVNSIMVHCDIIIGSRFGFLWCVRVLLFLSTYIKGKTKKWVIERELITKVGDIFNRSRLESDIKRLYSTSLFNDVKVTLKPVSSEPGKVIIVLGITEQRTGSLTGGIGYSGGQGVFGQIGLQESNLVGRSWTANMNITYGEYGSLFNY